MVTAVGSGEISVIMNSPLTAKAVLDTGRARLLAVCASQRVSSFPEVPTLREATGLSMPDMGSWIGLVAPAGTPPSIADRLHEVLNRTLYRSVTTRLR
jgi:tripartite-type tricarboxylate transporter receptor subunit TctC